MNLSTLTDLLIAELRDLYDAEKQLLKVLPLMAEKSFSSELSESFATHLIQTKEQVARLETIFQKLKVAGGGKHCAAMAGLVKEAQELMEAESSADPDVLDAALIGAAQKVEHYEIAGYGCARTFARQLGAREIANLLQKTLEEEATTDRLLTALAENVVNVDAAETDQEIFQEARGNGTRR